MSGEMPGWVTTVLMWEAKAIAVFAAVIAPLAMGVILVGIYKLAQHGWRDWRRKREAKAWHDAHKRTQYAYPYRTETDA